MTPSARPWATFRPALDDGYRVLVAYDLDLDLAYAGAPARSTPPRTRASAPPGT
ncbi:hypothetical protein [Streptomyces sp. NPDC048277]|uniref:hypothetical protein n=1 Tax=Streptomyces sp. NPDC048277 TaxID=3155027 RepID=UPI00340759F9